MITNRRDHRAGYIKGIGLWNRKLQENTGLEIHELQQQLYDLEGLQRNVDWLRNQLTELLEVATNEHFT